MTDTRETLQSRIDDAVEELVTHVERLTEEEREEFFEEPHDWIHECADGSVPVYNQDLLEIACADIAMALSVPEIGPAFDGTPTPINIIAANIYEAIEDALWDKLQDMKADWEANQGVDENGEAV